MSERRIVIVGGGFAGLSAYHTLARNLPETGYSITVIDPRDAFEYTPSIHELLDGSTSSDQLSIDFRRLLGTAYLQDTITRIERTSAVGESGITYPFDAVIVATGSSTNYFGKRDFKQCASGLKSIHDGLRLKYQLDATERVVVVGGGYTGVEIAGILATQNNKHIALVHGRDRLLHTMHPAVGKRVAHWLETHGVQLYLGDRVQSCAPKAVTLASGVHIESELTILSAGISPNTTLLGTEPVLNHDLSLAQYPSVFLAGDAAPSDSIQTAHTAMVEGRQAAFNVLTLLDGNRWPARVAHDWLSPIMAISLGGGDGMLCYGKYGLYLPKAVGWIKKLVEKRVMWELKTGIPLPL